MDPVSWAGSINLDAPAAGLLRRLAAALPPNREYPITVFGSAPIQITIDSSLTGADVGVFSDFENLAEVVEKAGLGEGNVPFFIQVSNDMANNCRRLWPIIYGREIDPRKEIIAPASAKRKAGYGEPSHDHK